MQNVHSFFLTKAGLVLGCFFFFNRTSIFQGKRGTIKLEHSWYVYSCQKYFQLHMFYLSLPVFSTCHRSVCNGLLFWLGGDHADNRISLRGNGVLWLAGLKRLEMCGTVEHTVETHWRKEWLCSIKLLLLTVVWKKWSFMLELPVSFSSEHSA